MEAIEADGEPFSVLAGVRGDLCRRQVLLDQNGHAAMGDFVCASAHLVEEVPGALEAACDLVCFRAIEACLLEQDDACSKVCGQAEQLLAPFVPRVYVKLKHFEPCLLLLLLLLLTHPLLSLLA